MVHDWAAGATQPALGDSVKLTEYYLPISLPSESSGCVTSFAAEAVRCRNGPFSSLSRLCYDREFEFPAFCNNWFGLLIGTIAF